MKMIRAEISGTDLFSEKELAHGACCFYTEDRKCKYIFAISGRGATLYANTDQYIDQAIEEFLFYSGFITSIRDAKGNVIAERTPSEPFLCDIKAIQPSQFYVNIEKLNRCKTWIKSQKDIIIPIIRKHDRIISLDGHTRLRAALDLGYASAYVYLSPFDKTIFHFVDEAIRRGIYGVRDMELVSGDEYKLKWDKFCDDLFADLPSQGEHA
ncbi:MAG: hypothetical protein ACOYI5_08665 [Christensenellales bacterium]|jgi:hypothetical protein